MHCTAKVGAARSVLNTLERARDALLSSPGQVSAYPRCHVGPVNACNRVPAAMAARSLSGTSGATAVVRTIQ